MSADHTPPTAHLVHGQPPAARRVPYRNLRHVLSLHAQTTPDAAFLIHYDAAGTRAVYSYAAFNARAHQWAGYLYDDLGVRRGDRVATLAYNHADTVIVYFACWLIGAVVAPQNTAEDDARLSFILVNSAAVVLVAAADYAERASRLAATAPGIRAVVPLHDATLTAHKPDTFMSAQADPPVTLDAEALLVYTSGTTGAPKGVVLSQYNLLADADSIARWHGFTGGQRMMNVLPIHHVNGIVVTLITPLIAGASVVLNRAFSSSAFWERIARENVQIVSVVPTLLQFCLDYADQQAARGESIWGEGVYKAALRRFRHFICGAGTLSVALVRTFEERFGLPVLHGYGLSETTCYSCFLPIDLTWDDHRRWLTEYGYPSIGCPIDANEMAIFSADGAGTRLGEGERGEICVRGHNVMQGYFARPDANADAFRFGWFRTGDEGFYRTDDQGRDFFFITGRIKELINRGGVKFSPFEIEEVLLAYPGVRVALAVAFPNTYYGEEVGAYVVPADGVTLDADVLIAHCRAALTFEKAPKVVVFGTDIPVTTTGKYQRLKLAGLFAAWHAVQFRPR